MFLRGDTLNTKILKMNNIPEKLVNIGEIKHYKKNDIVIQPGYLLEYMYVLINGELTLFRNTSDGKVNHAALVLPPYIIGKTVHQYSSMSFLSTVKCVKNSEIIIINKNTLNKTIESDIEFAKFIFNLPCYVINYLKANTEFQCLSNEKKIKFFLTEFAEEFGEIKNNKIKINYKITQPFINNLTGIELRTIANVLKKLRDENILEYYNGYYYISDLSLLKQ